MSTWLKNGQPTIFINSIKRCSYIYIVKLLMSTLVELLMSTLVELLMVH